MAMPFWKKFLVASLLVFSSTLFSCDTTVKGNAIENTPEQLQVKEITIPNDTTLVSLFPLPPPQVCTTIGFTIPLVTYGDVNISEAPPKIEDTLKVDTTIPSTSTMGTPVIVITSEKIGEIEMLRPDSLKTENPPKADSINCATQKYY